MAVTWLTPSDVTPGGLDDWIDVDDSNVPDTATGVILHIENQDLGDKVFGVRKNGSSDDRKQSMHEESHTWFAIGVDGSGIFEVYHADADIIVWLVGYFGDDAVFNTNGDDKTFSANGVFTDVDIAADTGGDTAIAAILEFGAASNNNAGVRKNGSTDDRIDNLRRKICWVIGVDGSEICEVEQQSGSTPLFLLGYITKEATLNTNATDVSLGSTGSWINLAALPAGSTGGIYHAFNFGLYGFRKDGTSENIVAEPVTDHGWALVECSASQIVEGQISTTACDFFEIGNFEGGGVTNTDRTPPVGSAVLAGQGGTVMDLGMEVPTEA